MREQFNLNDLFQVKDIPTILMEISQNVKKRRKDYRLTQQELSVKSGVSYGSIKRFEKEGEISLKSLVKIAIALECEEEFDKLFLKKKYHSIQEVMDEQRKKG